MPDFTLPELGENITAGDVLRVLVKPGDTLDKDQPVLELETDKATIEVPSSVSGKVTDIKVKAGDKVKVGQAILSVDDAGAGGQSKPAATAPAPDAGEESRENRREPRQSVERPTAAQAGADAKQQPAGAAAANSAEKVPADGAEDVGAELARPATARP